MSRSHLNTEGLENTMDDFEQELKLGFLEEASQLLGDTEQCFLALESNPNDAGMLDKIFRLAHNLKGSSKAVGFEDIGVFTHEFESFLLKLKNGELQMRSDTFSLLLRCNDHVRMMVETLKADLNARIDSTELLADIKLMSSGQAPEPRAAEEEMAEEPVSAEELELLNAVNGSFEEEVPSDEKMFEALAKETEKSLDAVQVAMAAVAKAEPAPAAQTKNNQPAADETIRVSLARLEKLINSVGELVILQTVLREQSLGSNPLLLRKTVHQMGKVTKEVQDMSMSLRMVPLKQTFQKMQRIVRDTSNMLNKKVNMVMLGEETELDKTVLENIGDPLVHLIRNACDHGIETPEKRREVGKPETGTVTLSAYHQSGKLVIEVKEDGGGIDGERLTQKAIEKGILRPGTKLPEQEAIHLIFHPGFSTKAQVTEVSGRGVGMDVVKTNIEALQGEVQVETVLGKGTTFKVVLPLTLAIIDGMVIRSDEDRFVIPLSHVHETLRPTAADVHKATGMGEVLLLRGENLPLYRLSQLLGRKEAKMKEATDQIVLVIRTQAQPYGVVVDDIIGQQQVVIKEVGKEIQNLKWMSGSAILGDGRPSIILEIGELVNARGKPVSASAMKAA
jgi:two-component system chemotaxis sensor kinase CheA